MDFKKLFFKMFGNQPDTMVITMPVRELKNWIQKSIESDNSSKSDIKLLSETSTADSKKTVEIKVIDHLENYKLISSYLSPSREYRLEYRKKHKKNLGNGDYKWLLRGLINLGVTNKESLLKLINDTPGGVRGLLGKTKEMKQSRIDLLQDLIKNI